MIKIVHPVAGAVALLTIAAFWLSTSFSELFGSPWQLSPSRWRYHGASCCSFPLWRRREAQASP